MNTIGIHFNHDKSEVDQLIAKAIKEDHWIKEANKLKIIALQSESISFSVINGKAKLLENPITKARFELIDREIEERIEQINNFYNR
jgi:hypothetical protein